MAVCSPLQTDADVVYLEILSLLNLMISAFCHPLSQLGPNPN